MCHVIFCGPTVLYSLNFITETDNDKKELAAVRVRGTWRTKAEARIIKISKENIVGPRRKQRSHKKSNYKKIINRL